jgi:hypothetical protein
MIRTLSWFVDEKMTIGFNVLFVDMQLSKNDCFLPMSQYVIFCRKDERINIRLPLQIEEVDQTHSMFVGKSVQFCSSVYKNSTEGFREKNKKFVVRQISRFRNETVFRDIAFLYLHLDEVLRQESGSQFIVDLVDPDGHVSGYCTVCIEYRLDGPITKVESDVFDSIIRSKYKNIVKNMCGGYDPVQFPVEAVAYVERNFLDNDSNQESFNREIANQNDTEIQSTEASNGDDAKPNC